MFWKFLKSKSCKVISWGEFDNFLDYFTKHECNFTVFTELPSNFETAPSVAIWNGGVIDDETICKYFRNKVILCYKYEGGLPFVTSDFIRHATFEKMNEAEEFFSGLVNRYGELNNEDQIERLRGVAIYCMDKFEDLNKPFSVIEYILSEAKPEDRNVKYLASEFWKVYNKFYNSKNKENVEG